MPDEISGKSGAKGYNRDGILGNRTMSQLTAMVNSNFTKVSANAVDIATAGSELAKKLTDALSWTELDAAKANPSSAAVPARSESIDCSSIDFNMLKEGIEGGNPAYAGCRDYYNSIISQSGGGGSSSNTTSKPPVDLDYLKRQASQWWERKQLDKMKLPGIPGIDYSKAVALLQKRKAGGSSTPGGSSSQKPLPPEVQPEDTEEIAFSETEPSNSAGDTTPELKPQSETASTEVVRTSSFLRDADGNIKPWVIGAGILGAAGLAWMLFSSGGNQVEYNEFGQPLQPYDENGMPIIQTNKYGQPLQAYDLQGRPVALTNRFGSPLQTYDENGRAVGRQNSDGSSMVLFDLENNIVYVNQVANVSVNAALTNPYGLYKRMY
jgi:YD repeat-containing protein